MRHSTKPRPPFDYTALFLIMVLATMVVLVFIRKQQEGSLPEPLAKFLSAIAR